ncbi:helix-turn-helix transcriptional regulator [Pseudobacteriovorax antillogorgiicola]|uniref:Regulatory protein, luxR family n=1 Tax=Pseudobacteriovorax antillogorgiicola TaxID=1513793 RepID=A0A1Y6C507_9BACT|nr:LuxR C-terminal-related transcriptional regulator [Pseudobacteriovorax antillogorgiicola]TCS50344.1 regulatory LuxR family protein [Pseudobacteriovorax antillogorgiicola]SMF34785.1 regulatory protein, luxR family [Pseudobacteriovorax antillogorgiicola]
MDSIRAFAKKYSLSKRESEILKLLITGTDVSGEYISSEFGISPNTARIHIKNMNIKFGTRSKGQMLQKFIREMVVG